MSIYVRCMGGSSGNCKTGQVQLSSSATTYIECGFEPKYIAVAVGSSFTSGASATMVYDSDRNSNTQYAQGSSATAIPTTSNNRIGSIDSNGFTLNKASATQYAYATYFAIGE